MNADRPGAAWPWVVVLACAGMVAAAFGAINNISVFLTPLAAEFGWPRADLSAAYSLATIGTGLGGILMGHFADRMPVRRVALCGAVVTGIALAALSRIDSTLELHLWHAVMGLAGLGAIMAPANSLASLWFPRRPGLAIGIVSAGGAAGQGLVPYFAQSLVLLHGWRYAYLVLGAAYLGVLIPLALLLRAAPRPAPGTTPPAATFAVSRARLLALLGVAVVLCCFCMATPIVHVVALGADRGLAGSEAAGLLATLMLFGMAGRVAFGRVADRIGNLKAYIAASAGQTAVAFLFPFATTRLELYALSALFGLVFSGAMTAFILCAREYSPPGAVGRSIGIVMCFAWLGMALGAWQGGLFYDLCGSYFPSFANASAGGVANLVALSALYAWTRRPVRPTGPEAPRFVPRAAGASQRAA